MFRLFCCLLFPVVTCAQVPDSVGPSRFLEVGIGYGQMDHSVDFTPAAAVSPLRGSEFGVVLRYFDNPLVGFQGELNYVVAGWREVLDESFATRYERRTESLELQMLTQFSPGRGWLQPLLQAGPYLAVPLREEERVPVEYAPPPDLAVPVYYGTALPFRLNYGLRFGAGLNLHAGPLTLQAEARYLLGFNDLIKTGTTQAAISRRAGLGARLGLLYRLRP